MALFLLASSFILLVWNQATAAAEVLTGKIVSCPA